VTFAARSSDTDVPLTSTNYNNFHQQWDNSGNAIGAPRDPRVYAPQPQAPARIPTFRTEGGGGYSTGGERYDVESGGDLGVDYPTDRVPLRQSSNESQTSSNTSTTPLQQERRVASPVRSIERPAAQQGIPPVQPEVPTAPPSHDATLPLQYAPQLPSQSVYTPSSAPTTPSLENSSIRSYPTRMATHPPPQQQYAYYPQGPQPMGSPAMFNPQTAQTPTQAQFVTMQQQHPQQTMDVTSPPLQTPTYPSEISQQMYTGMTTPTYASPQQTYHIPASLTPANTGGGASSHGHGMEPPPRIYTESPPSYRSYSPSGLR
jgi:hypothetical protein